MLGGEVVGRDDRRVARRVSFRRASLRSVVLVGALALTSLLALPSTALADEAPKITSVTELSSRLVLLDVVSPAMGRTMAVKVLLPADRSEPRGTLYLLDGNSGQIEENNWLAPANGDIVPFFADKNVNVVLPIGGTGTMYTDWQEDHPKFGRLKWETFLTKELPPLIDTRFATNGHNAIGGISMGAEAALILAQIMAGIADGDAVVLHDRQVLEEAPGGAPGQHRHRAQRQPVGGQAPAAGVDTPEDLERVRRHFAV